MIQNGLLITLIEHIVCTSFVTVSISVSVMGKNTISRVSLREFVGGLTMP